MEHSKLVSYLCEFLEPCGALVFGAEPIVGEKDWGVPFPWGPRFHSGAIATTRQNGWMELGFRESYLHQLFKRLGLAVERHWLLGYHHSQVWIGR